MPVHDPRVDDETWSELLPHLLDELAAEDRPSAEEAVERTRLKGLLDPGGLGVVGDEEERDVVALRHLDPALDHPALDLDPGPEPDRRYRLDP